MAVPSYQTGPGAHGTPNTRKLPPYGPRQPRPYEHGVQTPQQPGVTETGSSTRTTGPPSRVATFNTQPGADSQSGLTQDWIDRRTAGHQAEVAAVIAQMQAATGAQAAATEAQANAALAGLGGVAAQRQAALYGQEAGLRDIEQAVEVGVEAATSDALQRGIYNSGIRQENQLTAIREGAEAEADLRAQTAFALQGLAAQAAQIRASAAAIRASADAIRAQGAVQQTATALSMNREFDQMMLNNLYQMGYTPEEVKRIMGLIPPPSGGGRPSAGVRTQ